MTVGSSAIASFIARLLRARHDKISASFILIAETASTDSTGIVRFAFMEESSRITSRAALISDSRGTRTGLAKRLSSLLSRCSDIYDAWERIVFLDALPRSREQ